MKITIDSYIGRDGCSEREMREALAGLKEGEDVELVINSPGGDVYEGIAIFNLIRETAKAHTVSVCVNGLAASMATYIALAARTVKSDAIVKVSDNSIFMIHNPWTFGFGNYRDFEKIGTYLKQLAGVLNGVYASVSGADKKKIADLMDAETFFVGKEITENGFANEFEEIAPKDTGAGIENRDTLVVNARMKIKNCYDFLKQSYEKDGGDAIEKAAALLQVQNTGNMCGASEEDGAAENNGGSMNAKELFAKDKACYDEVFALGASSSAGAERERVSAHLKLAEKCGGYELAAKFIAEGKSTADTEVQAAYMDFAMNKSRVQNRADDDPPPVQTEGGDTAADEAAMMAEFDRGFAGKDFGGKQ